MFDLFGHFVFFVIGAALFVAVLLSELGEQHSLDTSVDRMQIENESRVRNNRVPIALLGGLVCSLGWSTTTEGDLLQRTVLVLWQIFVPVGS